MHRFMYQVIVAPLRIIPTNPFVEFVLPVSAALGSAVLELLNSQEWGEGAHFYLGIQEFY